MSEIQQSVFPSLSSSGTGIPLSPLFPPRTPPTNSYNPPSAPSSASSACLDLSTQGHTAGAFTPASQPAPSSPWFPLAQAGCFHFIWDAKSSFTEIRGGWEGKQVRGKCGRRMRREAVPALPRVSSGSQAWRARLFCLCLMFLAESCQSCDQGEPTTLNTLVQYLRCHHLNDRSPTFFGRHHLVNMYL